MTYAIAFALIALAAFLLARKRSNGKLRGPIPSSGWRVNHSEGALLVPHGAGWHIDIPAAPGHLNYVQHYGAKPRGSVTIRYRVDGGPILQSENGQPATAGLMLQREGDNLSARGKFAGYRWFCRAHLPLTEGEHEATVPLDPAQWGPTMSDPQAASFADCLANLSNLSIVFGGTGGRGHGVYGSGRFTLLHLN